MGILDFINPASLASSVVDGALGMIGNAQQNKYNMELAKYQNDYNYKMWQEQNEYNSPKATMERLTDAGINPRAFQQIGQFANSEKPAEATPMSKISELSAFQGVVRQSLENSLLKEQVKETQSNRQYKDALSVLTQRKASGQYNENLMNALEFCFYAADNGLGIDFNTSFKGLDYGFKINGQEVEFYDLPSVSRMISTFNERYDAKVSAPKLLNDLRAIEKSTKAERNRILMDYGIDMDGDSFMGALRFAIRFLEKTQ